MLMKAQLETLFYQYHVSAVISGHVHAYERSFPVFNDTVVSDGVQYFNIGDGGNREGHAGPYVDPSPSWSAYRLFYFLLIFFFIYCYY